MILHWQKELQIRLAAADKVAVLGIGSPLKTDDAAGMMVIEELVQRGVAGEQVLLIPGSTAPENFTGVIRGFAPDLLLAIDAAHMGLAPGAMALLDAEEQSGLEFSTHMLPFSVMLQYLAGMGVHEVLLLGLEPASTEFGLSATAPVTKAVRELATFLTENINHAIRA
ncbi:MAG: hydrogenase maturation protease [Clostridiales bacterium]|nr:hydrogenase maturation protease [Clostridiales bacterium]